MPKKTETIYDAQGRPTGTRVVGQDEDVVTKAKVQSTAGLVARTGQALAGDDRPKAADYKDDLPGLQKAWREYRAKPKK